MKRSLKNIPETKNLRKEKNAIGLEKSLGLLIPIVVILSFSVLITLAHASVELSSGKETLVVEPESKDSIIKFLNAGERITGKITVSGGDNYINFKLFDPDGNPILIKYVLQSDEFSWGPVEIGGDYKLEFDNWFDPSSTNTVSLEFQIISPLDNSFPTTLVIIIVLVLAIIIIPAAFLLHRHRARAR